MRSQFGGIGGIADNAYKKPAGELVYIPISREAGKYNLILAYKFDIYAAQPLSRDYIYVDATNGNIVAKDPIMKHAEKEQSPGKNAPISIVPFKDAKNYNTTLATGTADTKYSGTQNIETTLNGSGKYILHDTTRGGGIRTYNLKKGTVYGSAVDFEDNDNNWTAAEYDNAAFDNAALDAHLGVEYTYDYFISTFSRDSYDGLGSLLKSYIHYGNSYDNAAWTGSEMIYGDGASKFKPLTAFDVTAHELGHGVCSTSANLIYNRESGALNEGFSDIWGAAAEFKYAPTKQTWLIGEEITKSSPFYLRSMSNPKSGSQPDTYRGTYWRAATLEEGCNYPDASKNDQCGVHYNSGVLNHWFYILSVGKTGTNDIGNNYNVTGISIAKAEKIAYRLLTSYLTPNSDYKAAKIYGIQAAIDLFGANSPEAIATQNSFYAVGLGVEYSATPETVLPTAPTSLAASNTTGSQTMLTWTASTDASGIDRYLIFKNGIELTYVNGNKTTFIVTGLTSATAYNFSVKAVDSYENISTESNIVTVTTVTVPNYCSASSNSTYAQRIKRVKFGTIDNTSNGSDGYEDFSYLSTEVIKESTKSISIFPEWSGTTYSEGYAVFIDWNNDGDFDDADETAFTRTPTSSSLVTGNITVPAKASLGSVRMRVILQNYANPIACGAFNYGQVEDYTLNIINDIIAPTNPTNLTASQTTNTKTKLTWTAATDNVAVTKYVIYKNGVEISNVPANTLTLEVTGLTKNTNYDFYVKAVDAADNYSLESNTLNITTLNSPTYCVSTSTNTNEEKIQRVRFGKIDNTSTGTDGYEDFTYISTDFFIGKTKEIIIYPKYSGPMTTNGYVVYIDWNNDGDFDDANETALTKAPIATSLVYGDITVPATAFLGSVRMRIIMQKNASPISCGSFNSGQVEDYTLNLKNDTTPPTNPTNLVASRTTGTQTELNWNAATDNNIVTKYVIYKNGVEIRNVSGDTRYVVVKGLTTLTNYDFYVKAVDEDNNYSLESNTVNITTTNYPTYCESSERTGYYERIQRVQFGTIDNSSTSPGYYEDFTSISTDVTKEATYTITITPEWLDTIYDEGYAVFIDWNNDGDFDDTDETAFTKSISKDALITGQITVPASAIIGTVRMRVVMEHEATPIPCFYSDNGQDEDYTLNVKDKVLNTSVVKTDAHSIYPNPVNDILNIQSDITGELTYQIYNVAGQLVKSGKTLNKKISTEKLSTGNYILKMTDKVGNKSANKFIKK